MTNVAPMLRELREKEVTSLRGSADALNDRGVPTWRSARWQVSAVRNRLGLLAQVDQARSPRLRPTQAPQDYLATTIERRKIRRLTVRKIAPSPAMVASGGQTIWRVAPRNTTACANSMKWREGRSQVTGWM